jgi:hypothetical protein
MLSWRLVMPNCFQLFKKGSSQAEVLARVDDAICDHMQLPVHATNYCLGWFDVIGFGIAVGKPLGSPELRAFVANMPQESARLLQILDFLEANYTSNAFVEIGRR